MKRYAAVLVWLGVLAAYAVLHPPENLALGRGVLTRVPASFGPWNGTELSFANAVVEELKADDILIRRYEQGVDPVWLCIVYHENRRYGSHDPRTCYESQGYLIERPSDGVIADGTAAGVPVRWFVADRPRESRLVAYWWSTAGLNTRDSGVLRRKMATAGLLENRSWGAFVRLETPIRDGDEAAARRRLEDFGARVARVLPGVFAAPVRTAGS